jgi:hypothetical protein
MGPVKILSTLEEDVLTHVLLVQPWGEGEFRHHSPHISKGGTSDLGPFSICLLSKSQG